MAKWEFRLPRILPASSAEVRLPRILPTSSTDTRNVDGIVPVDLFSPKLMRRGKLLQIGKCVSQPTTLRAQIGRRVFVVYQPCRKLAFQSIGLYSMKKYRHLLA
uniref:Uncharacterized protein n=1 Tax=Grammatophora oceanica TaxID=210454 RepID=A0A7S1Y646_9STRA|mmetsp:Transcript_24871/g.36454  ORF Transcript_24871/g.36454 Transcript_24871/m.36454 type:complete len:104 (+) Transcript_24871:265-576(+)